MRRRSVLIGLLAGGATLATSAVAWAGPTKVEVQLGNPRTQVGQGVYVQVVVTAEGDGELSEPEFPELDGVQIVEQGTSFQSSMSFGTGQRMTRSVNKTFEYLLIPQKPGKFELGVTVSVGGKKIRPKRVPVLEVGGEAAVVAPEEAQADARPTSSDAEVFLWPTVDADVVYVGQPVLFQFEIWERTNADVQLRTMPSFDDFWVEELEAGRRRRDMVAGVPYRVHPLLERVLFPQKAGKLTIGGGEVLVTPHGGLGLLRPRRRRAPYQVPGKPIAIEVRPLPAEGQPPGFAANNVGKFAINSAVDRTKVEQGEGLTLTLTIEGTGNMRLVEPAEWPELSGLRRYDPTVDFKLTVSGGEVGGTRTYEFLLVAEGAGTIEIPPHSLVYFDPDTEEYVVAKSDPIRIEVEGDPNAAPTADADLEETNTEDESELLADIFEADALSRSNPEPAWLTRSRWLTGAAGVPATIGAGLAVRAIHQRITGDEASQRRAAQAAKRREAIERARGALASGDGFHGALAGLLQDVAVDRAGPEGVGLPRARLLDLLRERGVAGVEVEKLRELLDTCDAARFGAGGSDEGSRRELFHAAQALIESSAWKGGHG